MVCAALRGLISAGANFHLRGAEMEVGAYEGGDMWATANRHPRAGSARNVSLSTLQLLDLLAKQQMEDYASSECNTTRGGVSAHVFLAQLRAHHVTRTYITSLLHPLRK